jgi:hypothetical protein
MRPEVVPVKCEHLERDGKAFAGAKSSRVELGILA